jgi:hypothetical protein
MSRSSLSQFPSRPRAVQSIFFKRIAAVSRQENGLDSGVLSEFRRKPEFSPARSTAF